MKKQISKAANLSKVDCLVLMPVGPNCKLSYIFDTIESIYFYMGDKTPIIIVDDSMQGKGKQIVEQFPNVNLITNVKGVRGRINYGLHAGLYLTLSKGLEFAVENYDFEVLLRLDTDALIIDYHPELDAIEHFKSHPDLGLIGSFRIDCNGDLRGYAGAQKVLRESLKLNEWIKHPRSRTFSWLKWKILHHIARKNGYEPGDQCMGGAYFMSRQLVEKLYHLELLGMENLAWIKLEEDQLFGLLTYVAGLKLGDFSTGNYSMGLRHKGLPDHPENLVLRGYKVTHSTKFYNEMNEDQIREFFRSKRKDG